MNAFGAVSRLMVCSIIVVLMAGCGAAAGPTPTPATASPASPPQSSVPSVPVPSVSAPTPTVVVTNDVAYESSNSAFTPGVLDVYASTKVGPRPVVVMLPAGDKRDYREHAGKVADLGFVVFVPNWGVGMATGAPGYDDVLATSSEAACAVEFTRAHAAEYGGDPATMIVFGHSAGAHPAAMVTFARPAPTTGCLASAPLGAIDALVTWEGNWLLSVNEPDWESALAADPRVMNAATPWRHLAEHKDQRVVMLVSQDPNVSLHEEYPGVVVERPVGDLWAADSWLAVRDPSGDLRRQLEANGAFADGTIGFTDSQQLLYSVLKAQGNPVTLDVMPDSSHAWVRGAGWDVFLAAFEKAAAKG